MFADAAGNEALSIQVLWRFLFIWLAIAVIGGIGVLVLWFKSLVRDALFPRQRLRQVPWNFVAIALALFVIITGEALLAQLFGLTLQPDSTSSVQPPNGEKLIWFTLLVRLLQIATILFVLLKAARARAYQLGLTTHRWAGNLVLGYLFWLVLTPIVFGLWQLLIQFEPADPHPFEKIDSAHAATVWLVLPLLAIVVGPLAEELLFRGVIQPWMTRSPEMADLVFVFSLITAIVMGIQGESRWPLLFLVTAGPGYLAFEYVMRPWLPRRGVARAIYATSILFAAVHGSVWPSPMPLFFLSLGLGFLSYRTQSLIGPLVVHAFFNVISTVTLLVR